MEITTASMLDGLAEIDVQPNVASDGEDRFITLRNLHQMPKFGLGCGLRASFREEVVQFGYEKCGIRLFDVSSCNGTEEALRKVSRVPCRAFIDKHLTRELNTGSV